MRVWEGVRSWLPGFSPGQPSSCGQPCPSCPGLCAHLPAMVSLFLWKGGEGEAALVGALGCLVEVVVCVWGGGPAAASQHRGNGGGG